MKYVARLVVVFISAVSCPALAQTTGPQTEVQSGFMELATRTREARLAGDNQAWLQYGRRVLALVPDHPDLLISVARALAANGRTDEALTRLEDAINRGAGFDLSTFPELKAAAGIERLESLRARALKNQLPVAPAEVFLALEDGTLQPEGITYDPASRHIFIGSRNGEIWRVDPEGALSPFVGPGTGLREVLGLKVDPQRRLLWAVTGVFPDLFATGEPKKDVGITGLHAYDLNTRARKLECMLDERPTLHGFNDLALARNGDVYVTDSAANSIYRLRRGECEFERLLLDPAMSFPNGIVLMPDESRLYVAHVEGISAVDAHTGKRTQLAVPWNGAVNSIDGMALEGADLLGIQGSPYLARIARVRLSDDGLAIREVVTVSSRPPMGLNQTTGVVVGSHFYTVAGFPDALAPAAGEEQRVAHILRARLR